MNGHDEEEDSGPSVDSTDPEERIAARRIRISKRVEMARREALGEDPSSLKKEDKEEQSKSKRQIEDSRQRLTKLESDGSELVTNVRVAADAREAHRRTEEEEIQRQRNEKLEAEAKAGMERFDEITKKWEQANSRDLPMELHDLLKQQKSLSEAMIDEKNKLINDFQMELKSKDDQYVKDLKKQAEDIDLMIDRMEEQVKNLTKAYRDELTQIEKSFETERGELLDNSRRKWEQALTGRGEQELEYMRQRERRVEEYDKQLQHLRIQDADEYNMVKIKLETDVQVLEQQLQQMKATYQLNQEKLEYNFQVLKKRDEENTITKSQQKRKITRLQDVMNNLKVKLSKQEKQYREENQGLADDYKRITEQFKELQKKSKHFQATDTRKFHDIWCMNEEEVKELASRCLEQDRIITQQQLGMSWKTPQDTWFMDNVGPIRSQKSQQEAKATSAHDVLREVMSTETSVQGDEETVVDSQPDGPQSGEDGRAPVEEEGEKTKISVKTIKRVLELLCDESGFLVESKLNTLLAPLEKDERNLMKLDAIFGALGVETEEDVHKLANFFIKYQTLAEAPAGEGQTAEEKAVDAPFTVDTEKQAVTDDGDTDAQALSHHTASQVAQPSTTEAGQAPEGAEDIEQDEFEEGENAEILEVTGGQEETAGSIRSVRSDAPELIHPNDVAKALREFVNQHSKPTKEKVKFQTFRIISGEERDDSEDAAYWASFPSVLSEKQEKVWKALLDGLEKYSDVLNQRAKLITETDSLRQQNAELRMLLHQYINSKVNQELEIPPTKVLNLDVPQ
ncbi:dynein regulatory complex protein 1-like [Acanthaster planci]|uniref:Dynein regulatory complex protein 1-like n=1 Tax=Acanthaster planci TaxID=133434 RepID=A0A8B7ZFX8_ACAPL|nr:dynein regulatory complex protein 1-like [Acanthaster planci]